MKIPKGQSESVYRRRTDNTMTEKKGQKDKKSLKIPKGQTESVCRRRTDNRQQTTKEKVQKDKQRSTKHTYKTKDRVT